MTKAQGRRKLPMPKRQVIVDHYRDEILSGRRRPGGRLPSSRVIARKFGVGQDTGARALEALGQEGLAVRGIRRGEGWFVSLVIGPCAE